MDYFHNSELFHIFGLITRDCILKPINMEYIHRTPEDLRPTFYIQKERSRTIILKLGYDFIEFKRKFKKDLNRLKYYLPRITFNSK